MKYIEENGKIIMTDFESFNIEEILECGQCFRFEKIENMHYTIIANRKVLNIRQIDNKVEFYPCTKDDFEKIWINYFDLQTDYNKIKKQLENDEIVKKAIEYADGIRILNQDSFECLISFIISQNNRIPMIKQVIKNISEKYGEKEGDYYIFPTIEQLKKATPEELKLCKTGFRDKYILDAIQNIENGVVKLEELYNIPSQDAKNELLKIKGVGTKVADCVLLFSLKKNDVFPTDVWVKRVMEYFYFDEKDTSIQKIHNFAKEKWGDLAGYAQQYLFYYARSEKIGTGKK
ncbi:DNA-3-methyladenine glycosylase family protein [[Clostridium] colinum]|uniref:DNA-3-methyladenine glycosylase family protein n=1 Tax=[Clostridium] colinum TaxID=36835 RepID=UPI00202518AF|nr:DNA glycosylase [[Clostridium] colinum]